jgi:peptidyl-prolyl cis-trans isomerase A (cyclophilin A)
MTSCLTATLAAALLAASVPATAQFNGIFADFDVGSTPSPEIPGPLSFTVYLDSTTGLSDTANADRLVANFIRLAEGEDGWVDPTTGNVRKEPFFDGLTFYKLSYTNNSVNRIYFGSRTGDGTDDPGWVVQDDFRSDAQTTWALYMDNDGPNTNGCRFFISSWNDPSIAGKYPRMGYVLQNSPVFPVPNNGPSLPRPATPGSGSCATSPATGSCGRRRRAPSSATSAPPT